MKGKNIIKCVHRSTQTVKSFAIWLFNKDDRFVIMDIDGTITKSDLRGYVTTVYMGLYSYVHDGVIEFLNYLVNQFDYKILYLTARPMAHRNITEDFLKSSKNELGQQLPEGPLLTSRDRISLALYKEVVLKESALTKADILNQVILAFRQAGNTKITPFVLGIGNKETDAG
jgi:phosphatidate phosphatase LPIN